MTCPNPDSRLPMPTSDAGDVGKDSTMDASDRWWVLSLSGASVVVGSGYLLVDLQRLASSMERLGLGQKKTD